MSKILRIDVTRTVTAEVYVAIHDAYDHDDDPNGAIDDFIENLGDYDFDGTAGMDRIQVREVPSGRNVISLIEETTPTGEVPWKEIPGQLLLFGGEVAR